MTLEQYYTPTSFLTNSIYFSSPCTFLSNPHHSYPSKSKMSSSEAPKDASSSTAGQSQLGDVETTYNGNCHCGALQYSIVLPRPLEEKPSQVASCNCSICTRNGYLLVHPKTEAVTFIKGSLEELGCYQFGKVCEFQFMSGIRSFSLELDRKWERVDAFKSKAEQSETFAIKHDLNLDVMRNSYKPKSNEEIQILTRTPLERCQAPLLQDMR